MTKKKEQRFEELLNLLTQENKIEVARLSDLLHVSQVTIRKDLDELEEKGFVQRQHGFASLSSPDNISGRLAWHYDAKKKIAQKAAGLIHDHDTVMIESGSCCAILASILAQSKKDITIITNSAFIADYVRHEENVNLILLGGIYQKDSQCLVGPSIRDSASNYNVTYFFAGTDGWSERTGFTNKDQMRAQAVRDMAHSAEKLVILTKKKKFEHPGTVPLNVKNQPACVITDQNIPDNIKKVLEKSCEVVSVD